MQNIKNIIFDLGGVILNIDFKKTEEAFRKLGLDNFSDHISQHHITDFFRKYEMGLIDDDTFVADISKMIGKPVTAEEIIAAWNALLLDFPPARIELLKKLHKKYRTFLLSNTNSIHLKEFNQRLFKERGVYLEDIFEKTYYSHAVNLRKPDAAIFELVIKENNLVPEETLFIDDTASNFPEAEKMGIKVHHVTPDNGITDIKFLI
ncbi:MAG: HAD family phosphatase [Chitinophagaceae bacterium]